MLINATLHGRCILTRHNYIQPGRPKYEIHTYNTLKFINKWQSAQNKIANSSYWENCKEKFLQTDTQTDTQGKGNSIRLYTSSELEYKNQPPWYSEKQAGV